MKCNDCGLTLKSLDDEDGECPDCGGQVSEGLTDDTLLKK